MKQLISFKQFLFMVFILSAGIFYQACQKDDKVSPKNNEFSVNVKDASAAKSGCSAVLTFSNFTKRVKATNAEEAKATVKDFIRKSGNDKCISRGSCVRTCGFTLDEGSYQDQALQYSGDMYQVTASGKGECACAN